MTKLTQWDIQKRLCTVAETPIFCRQAEALLDADQRQEVILALATDPLAGVEIPGTGGIRKMRIRARGKGKRGGARVIYFFTGNRLPVYALLVYLKSAKNDLTPSERRQLASLAAEIKAHREERR